MAVVRCRAGNNRHRRRRPSAPASRRARCRAETVCRSGTARRRTFALIWPNCAVTSKPRSALARMSSELASKPLRPSRRLIADRRLDFHGIGHRVLQAGLDAVGLERRRRGSGSCSPALRRDRNSRRRSSSDLSTASPSRRATFPSDRSRGTTGEVTTAAIPLHRVGIVDRPLKRLEPAIGRADDRHQFFDAEMIEQQALGRRRCR